MTLLDLGSATLTFLGPNDNNVVASGSTSTIEPQTLSGLPGAGRLTFLGPAGQEVEAAYVGAAGQGIVSATINESDELVFTTSNSTEINAGNMITALSLKPLAQSADLGDVESGTLSTGLIQGGTF